MSPLRSLLVLEVLGAVSVVATGCSQHGGCTDFCPPPSDDLTIDSACGNLVSAQDSCGQSAVCNGASPCSALALAPPPQGGDCQVTVTFSDGKTKTVDADWGALRADACCGSHYQSAPGPVLFCQSPTFPADASIDVHPE